MIPLRDTIRSRSYPFVTYFIIAANTLVFCFQLSLGPEQTGFIAVYSLIPARFTHPDLIDYFGWGANLVSLFTFMFLHGGFWHLLGNMWTLYIFGDNIEDHLGPVRFLLFYLLAGGLSGLVHMVLHPDSPIPTVGASGAIAGVMGAYFILYPRSRILTLIPVLIFPWLIEIPAFVFLGIWFVIQFLGASGADGAAGGIAWGAHVGGFVAGIVLLYGIGCLPSSGVTRRLQAVGAKKHTHHLQVISPRPRPGTADLYGHLQITSFEALAGTRKILALALGVRRRTFRVTVPPGIQAGKSLRLRGLGQVLADGRRGDLYLTIEIVPL